jgi:hypothetical protein
MLTAQAVIAGVTASCFINAKPDGIGGLVIAVPFNYSSERAQQQPLRVPVLHICAAKAQ